MLTLEDWATLESSVVQPSRLLDAVLTDLYGPRRCVTSGVFPAVLLFGHPGYVRAVNAIEVPGRNQFFLYMAVPSAGTGPGALLSIWIGRRYWREPGMRWPTVGSSRTLFLTCTNGSGCPRHHRSRRRCCRR